MDAVRYGRRDSAVSVVDLCCTALVQRRSLAAQTPGSAKLAEPLRTNERPKVHQRCARALPSWSKLSSEFDSDPTANAAGTHLLGKLAAQTLCLLGAQLTPEEEKRRKEVIKIYEEAKAEAAKEEKRRVRHSLPLCCPARFP